MRGMTYVAGLGAALLMAACTAHPGSSSTSSSNVSVRRLAGQPMASCTIKGDYPVQAQASALCGSLRVPEDPSDPTGRGIALRVAVVPAVGPDLAPDPLFVLAGGPGDAGTQFFAWLPALYAGVHATRDIVLVDQRGTGDSNPMKLPAMPETAGMSTTGADRTLAAWAERGLASIDADPRDYTTTLAADDIDAVRAGLAYDKIDLYGTSYGGTLAQYYLRQHADRVRVAVLDGSTPVDVPVFERMAASSQAALDLLFRRCAQDAACRTAFPRLGAEWEALLRRLATPLTITDPGSGQKAVVDRIELADAIHSALLTEAASARIPLTIHLAQQNRWLEAAQLIGSPPTGGPTLVMADEILCSESWARFDPARVARSGAGAYALPRELAQAEQRAAMCRHLPHGVVRPDDGAAVHTDTPVLWLVGDGDPQDPPANLTRVQTQQANSRIVVVPAQQHVVGPLGCLPSVIAAFLNAGSVDRVDTSCVSGAAAVPPFRLR